MASLHRPHITGRELVPGVRELLAEERLVLREAVHKLGVRSIREKRNVRGKHHYTLWRNRRRRVGLCARLPLIVSPGSNHFAPVVRDQIVEVLVAPLGRRGGPGALEAGREGIVAFAGAA